MSKKVLIRGSLLNVGGYPEHARFAYRSLKSYIAKNNLDYELFAIPTKWGQTGQVPMNSPEFKEIDALARKTQEYVHNKGQFDMSVQVTIPNEFEMLAPLNVGITAGIESDRVAPLWIQKSNMMTRILVPSSHAANGFTNCGYSYVDENTKLQRELRLTTPMFVVPYPDNTEDFRSEENVDILDLPTKFNFLTVAQLGPRKNIDMIIKGFCQEFASRDDVGLVLKVSIKNNCKIDKSYVEKHVQMLMRGVRQELGYEVRCKVYLVHGDMTDKEMYLLNCHSKIKAFISLSTGEGYGLPIFSAALAGLPIIAPDWSGYTDFLHLNNEPMFAQVAYEIKPVQKEAVWENVITPDSNWCYPNYQSYRATMRSLFNKIGPHKVKAEKLALSLRESHKQENVLEAMAETILAPLLSTEDKTPIDLNEPVML